MSFKCQSYKPKGVKEVKHGGMQEVYELGLIMEMECIKHRMEMASSYNPLKEEDCLPLI